MSQVSVAKQRETLKHINKSCILKKQFEHSTKAHDTKECEICGHKLKSEKGMNEYFTKTHEDIIYPSGVKCAFG